MHFSGIAVVFLSYHCFLPWSTSELRVRLVPLDQFKPSSKIFLLTVPKRYFFCGSFMLFLSCVCYVWLLIVALWSPAWKGWPLGSRLWFITFPLVSCISNGTWLYRFLIFVLFLTLHSVLLMHWFGLWSVIAGFNICFGCSKDLSQICFMVIFTIIVWYTSLFLFLWYWYNYMMTHNMPVQ